MDIFSYIQFRYDCDLKSFNAEASDLQLPPGKFPDVFAMADWFEHKEVLFYKLRPTYINGELASFLYHATINEGSFICEIFND